MAVVRSYIAGRWFAPDSGAPVYDAVTGDEVAEVSSDGIDFAPPSTTAGRSAAPRCATLTFHQRAELREGGRPAAARAPRGAVRAVLPHRRDALRLEVRHRRRHRRAAQLREQGQARAAERHGAASRARPSSSARAGTFLGQHLLTPRRGVAVQINAFNFPVWGPLEKLAPALIAGVPTPDQAGLADRLPHRADGRADHRVRAAARGRPAAGQRQRGRPARPPRRAGPAQLHRLGEHRAAAADATRTSSPGRCGSTPRPTR